MDGIRFPNGRHSGLITSNYVEKSRQPSSATIQRRMGMAQSHEGLRPADERHPDVGHNLYAATYVAVISRRVPPFVRSWLIVFTKYFQSENTHLVSPPVNSRLVQSPDILSYYIFIVFPCITKAGFSPFRR